MEPIVHVGEMFCPFPRIPHPRASEVEDEVVAWAQKFGYVTDSEDERDLRHSGIANLGCWAAPLADVEGAALLGKWLVWMFLMDDHQVEAPAQTGEVEIFALHVLRCRRAFYKDQLPFDAEPQILALADLRRGLDKVFRPETAVRIADGFNDYLLACACEIMLHTRATSPTLDEYTAMRESLVAMRSISMTLSAAVQGCELPAEVWADPQVQELERVACRIIGYVHDYHSGPRELRWDGGPLSYLHVLARDERLSPQEAMDRLNDMNTRETRRFLVLAARVRQHSDPRVVAYVAHLERWIRGNYDWSRECGRYHIDQPEAYTTSPGAFGR